MHNVVIDPVSRIEGHAKITLRLDDAGHVDDARFHVTEFRGFEEFCRGRTLWEMPGLTSRTCGICPMSHLIASAKAADAVLAVAIPPAAELLRRLGNLGQIVQSHALSYFHLSAPDLLLGMESDPALRNVFGLIQTEPEIARRGIALRRYGQEIVAAVSGKRVHGPGIVPGGVAAPLAAEVRDSLAAGVETARQAALDTIDEFVALVDRFTREIAVFGAFDSLFLAHCGADGRWETYGDRLRVTAADGSIVADGLDPADYRDFLGEAGGHDSYLKSPYWRATVTGDDLSPGMYRVGPLARLNVASHFGTEAADAALLGYRERTGAVASSSFHYHYARLLEVLAAVEQIEQLLADPVLLDTNVRAQAGVNRRRGVGSSEAPRGTLFHDYTVNEDGVVEAVNMLIATGQNNLAMNRTVLQVAREYVTGPAIPEGTLNRIEAGIRAFDPCLSCSTHALGQMPMVVQLLGPDGELIREVRRD